MNRRVFENYVLIDCVLVSTSQYDDSCHITRYDWDCYYTTGKAFSKPVKVRVSTYEAKPLSTDEAAQHVLRSFVGFTNGTGFLYITESIIPAPTVADYRVVKRISIKDPYPTQRVEDNDMSI